MKIIKSAFACLALLCSASVACAQFGELTKKVEGMGGSSGLSDSKIGSGLKEALEKGAENAVAITGKTDGFYGNQAIKILLPKNIRPLEGGWEPWAINRRLMLSS